MDGINVSVTSTDFEDAFSMIKAMLRLNSKGVTGEPISSIVNKVDDPIEKLASLCFALSFLGANLVGAVADRRGETDEGAQVVLERLKLRLLSDPPRHLTIVRDR